MLQKNTPTTWQSKQSGRASSNNSQKPLSLLQQWNSQRFHSTDFSVTINRSSNYDIVNRNQSTVSTTTTQNDLNVPFL